MQWSPQGAHSASSATLSVTFPTVPAAASTPVPRRPRSGAVAAAGGLDNGGTTLTPPLGGVTKRRRSWALRDQAALLLRPEQEEGKPFKKGPAVCGCGRAGYEVEMVGVHLNEKGVASTSGTLRCGSGWHCHPCAMKLARERQERVGEIYDTVAYGLKGQMPMVTLTVRHRQGMALSDLRRVEQDAWKAVRQGAPWARLKKRFGILGTVTAPEVTWSVAFGWHFHMHIAVPCLTDREGAFEVGSWIIDRYIRYVRLAGYDALSQGQDVTLPTSPEKAADYLAKGVTSSGDIAWELAGAVNKRGRSGSLHPFDILEASPGDARMAALWREYAAAMKGARSCVISAALAKKVGMNEDDDAQEPTVEEPEGETIVGELPAYVWNAVMRRRLGSTILSVIEDDGPSAWPRAEYEAYRIAGFDPPGRGEPARSVEILPYAPTAAEIAQEVLSFRWSERTYGGAIRKVMDLARGRAVAGGFRFVPPDLRYVMKLIAESR